MIVAIIVFLAVSVVFSLLVVAACMLSSGISQEEGVVEAYEQSVEETGPATAQM